MILEMETWRSEDPPSADFFLTEKENVFRIFKILNTVSLYNSHIGSLDCWLIRVCLLSESVFSPVKWT